MSSESEPTSDRLAWRIPEASGISPRFALAQVGFVTVVVCVFLLFLSPTETLAGRLGAVLFLGGLLASWQILRMSQETQGQANLWLDDAGLHWLDREGNSRQIDREAVQAYYIGRDEETSRGVDSLVLILRDEFVSQPVELHPPADPSSVAKWLQTNWAIASRSQLPAELRRDVSLTSTYDTNNLRWTFAGELQELAKLVEAWTEAAKLISLPPLGVRPKQMVIDFSESDMAVGIASQTWIDAATLYTTNNKLTEIAATFQASLALPDPPKAMQYKLVCDTGHHWTIVFELENKPT